MKTIFWVLSLSSLLLIVTLYYQIIRKKMPKKSFWVAVPLLLITVGFGYLHWLQYDSDRNMRAISEYFDSNCSGYVMKPLENPIEVQACGNKYHVKATDGNIVMLKQLND